MNRFTYATPSDLAVATATLSAEARPLAGGIDLLSSMKQGIATPATVVNLKSIEAPGLRAIEGDKNLRVGALVTLRDLAEHAQMKTRYAALVDAARSVGSPQIRHVGTVGGNLCQRPRCWYFRDEGVPCLKKGGATCFAEDGRNAYHAVLRGGPCHIVHPSDLAPAFLSLDARVLVHDGAKERAVPIAAFFVHPEDDVERETILKDDELVVAVELPLAMAGWNGAYFKMRERESFDWALASAAVNVKLEGDVVVDARVALGGVAPVPVRSEAAEAALKGKPLTDATAQAAGKAAFADAVALGENAYKLTLGPNVVRIAALRAVGKEEG